MEHKIERMERDIQAAKAKSGPFEVVAPSGAVIFKGTLGECQVYRLRSEYATKWTETFHVRYAGNQESLFDLSRK